MNMKLSIVIPCYNMEKYLPQCLESLYRQDLDQTSYEIIVVDDGSIDGTMEVAKGYAQRYPNLQIIDKQNEGVGSARNSGMDLAIGKYLYFLDPDDYLANNVLGTLIDLIEKNNLDVLIFNSLSLHKEAHWESFNINEVPQTLDIMDGISYIASKKFQPEVWRYFIDREFLKGKGLCFIEGRWMEDAIFTATSFCKAQRLAHTSLDVHRYRLLPTSAMRNKTPEHYNKVIFDNAHAAYAYHDLINSISKNHPNYTACAQRLKTRQQSFVFFLLVRWMKSDLEPKKIPEMLFGLKKIGAYPLDHFLGPDYHGPAYSFMTFIFNRRPLIGPFIKIFRIFYKLVK